MSIERQRAVYASRAGGRKPSVPFDPQLLERQAERSMSRERFDYVAGGAGAESTMRENRRAFDRWRIVPHTLRDVSSRDTSVELFGRRLPYPLLLAPIGVLEEAHRDADLAVARAASRAGLPLIMSNQASVPMERCAAVMGSAPRWFQLYYSSSDELVESLVRRAEACGCEAIVVTLDTTLLGWRSRDLSHAYLPFLYGRGIAQYVSDPVFQASLEGAKPGAGMPRPGLGALGLLLAASRAYRRTRRTIAGAAGRMHAGRRERVESLLSLLASRRAIAAVNRFTDSYSRPSLGFREIDALRRLTKLPIVLKGVLHPDEARRALAHGIDAIIVSNHGGRQVDGAIASLDALPEVVAAVKGRIPVLLDSGVRGGADAFKALALGARAVCIGRPYAYGLAVAGERGVGEVIANFACDFELTMALSGCRSISEIGAASVVRATSPAAAPDPLAAPARRPAARR